MGRLRSAGLLALWLAAMLPGRVAAADVLFGEPTATSTFETGVAFTQPITLTAAAARVELLVTTADASGPLVVELPPPSGTGAVTLGSTLDPSVDGHILPNTPLRAQWRVTTVGASEGILGPEVAIVYRDDRFEWRTVSGDVVRVHWYEGDAAFGERALRIGERAVRETADLLGVTEDDPVDFFIYPDQASFYDALGPGTRENVGGQANAGIRTLFALIGPGAIDDPWVSVVVPHELVHLVFDTAVSNPYHFPPRWLNEGVATYLSEGYGSDYRRDVEQAARDRELIPLDGLAGQFPTTADRFFLAYAESVSAVDFLIRTHGEAAMVSLIRSYADGRTDDEAFTAAIGQDVATFTAAWLADLGADAPERLGPQPAPPGPVPADWTLGGSPDPGAGTAGPSASVAPTEPNQPGVGDGSLSTMLLVGVLAVVLIAIVLLVWRRGRRPAPSATIDESDGPRLPR